MREPWAEVQAAEGRGRLRTGGGQARPLRLLPPCRAIVVLQGQLCSLHTEPGPLSLQPLPLRTGETGWGWNPSHTQPPRPLQALGTAPHTPQDHGVRARGAGVSEAICRKPQRPHPSCPSSSCSLFSLCPSLRFPHLCLCLCISLSLTLFSVTSPPRDVSNHTLLGSTHPVQRLLPAPLLLCLAPCFYLSCPTRPLCPPLISVSLGLPPVPQLKKETEAQVLERQQKAGATGLSPLSLWAGWPCLHLHRWSWRTRFSRDGLQREPGLQLLACSEPWFAPEKRCSEGTYGPSRGKPVPQRPGVLWGGGRVGD